MPLEHYPETPTVGFSRCWDYLLDYSVDRLLDFCSGMAQIVTIYISSQLAPPEVTKFPRAMSWRGPN